MAKKKTTTTKKKTAPKKEGTSLISENTTIKITLPAKEVTAAYEKTLVALAKNITAEGFRKGKVPAKVAEEKIGRERIIQEALNQLLPGAYQKALTESKKNPITQPEFSLVEAEMGKDWVIEARFAEVPTVKLGSYQKHVKEGLKAANTELKKKENKEMKEEQQKEVRLQHVFRELVTQIKPQVPEMLLKHETQHEFEHMSSQIKQLGMSVDDYLEKRQMNMEQLSQELAVNTLSRLQLDLILGAIAKEQKLTVTDKDKEKFFKTIPDEKQREQLSKDQHYLGHLETNLMKQKVVDYLLA